MNGTDIPAGVVSRLWQRSWARGLTVALVLLLLSLTAVQPFTRGVLPLTADGTLHMYRALVLDHSLRHDGSPWPRYSSALAYGYGAPLFNYFSPLTYHVVRLLHLAGLGFVDAFLWSMVSFVWLAAGGAYLLGRAWSDEFGGLAAAVAYVYAPYLLFDTVTRGTNTEVLALAVLPWVMWALRRLAYRRRRADFLLAVTVFAVFIPLHNVVTLHAGLLLVPYCAFLWLTSPVRARTFVLLMLAALLAVALTAFFWWPALAEVGSVRIDRVADNLELLDVVANLLTPGDLFGLPRTADPAQLQAPTPITVGWPALLLGLVGVMLAWRGGRRERTFAGWAALMVALLLFLNTRAAAGVWQTVPLLGYSQFPWRLLGPTSLLLAVLAGTGVAQVAALIAKRIAHPAGRIGWIGLALAALMIYGIPWLYRVDLPEQPAESITDWLDYEAASGQVAAGSYGEYLPIWNEAPLDPGALRARFAEREVIPRLEPPPGVTVQSAEWQGTGVGLVISAAQPATLVFDWLYMPGWRADMDGQPLTVEPQPPLGRVGVEVPAGEHRLSLWLGPTPLQSAAVLVSLGALLAMIVLVTVGWRWLGSSSTPVGKADRGVSPRLLLAAGLVGLAVFLGKTLIVDHVDSPLRRERFPAGGATLVDVGMHANFGQIIDLLGADLPEAVPSGGSLPVDLFWRLVGEPVAVDYSSTVTLRDPAGSVVTTGGSFMPGNVATRHWLPGAYVQERLDLLIPAGTPPGVYTLEAGLYDPQTLQALSRINEAGNPADVKAIIGPITVTRPDTPALPAIEHPVEPSTAAGLTLLGFDLLPDSADAGQEIGVVWHWRAESAPTQEVRGQVVWLDGGGDLAAATPAVPLTPGFPVVEWRAGESWTGRAGLYVPGRLDSGVYTVGVILVENSGTPLGEPVEVGRMTVRTPDRVFDRPDPGVPVDIAWANGISLLGYDRVDDDQAVNVTLYWQADDDLTTSLRLFVHLLDSADRIAAQSDGVPVDWTRPTTGWAPGEIVTTRHDLAAAPGDYTVRVGWYDPVTGARVPLEAGQDYFLLPALEG